MRINLNKQTSFVLEKNHLEYIMNAFTIIKESKKSMLM